MLATELDLLDSHYQNFRCAVHLAAEEPEVGAVVAEHYLGEIEDAMCALGIRRATVEEFTSTVLLGGHPKLRAVVLHRRERPALCSIQAVLYKR